MLNDPTRIQSAKSGPHEALYNLNPSIKNFYKKKNGADVYNERKVRLAINHKV